MPAKPQEAIEVVQNQSDNRPRAETGYKALLGSAGVLLVTVIAFAIVLVLMKSDATGPQPLIHSIFLVALLGICMLGSVALDVGLFEYKRNQAVVAQPAYHPNLRIWGLGVISGISTTIIYLITAVILSLIQAKPVTHEILYQYALLLAVLIIAIAFTIWGIVQVCRGE